MKTITCQQMHDALVESIEERWIPLSEGKILMDVPDCQLCDVTYGVGDCDACPLYLTDNYCHQKGSPWRSYYWAVCNNAKKAAALHMLEVLRMCKDKYFPKGWDK
jgi:hypothetical protein